MLAHTSLVGQPRDSSAELGWRRNRTLGSNATSSSISRFDIPARTRRRASLSTSRSDHRKPIMEVERACERGGRRRRRIKRLLKSSAQREEEEYDVGSDANRPLATSCCHFVSDIEQRRRNGSVDGTGLAGTAVAGWQVAGWFKLH